MPDVDGLRVAAAQLRPVWLDPHATARKAAAAHGGGGAPGADVVAFPETFLAGYPFWLGRTNGAAFEDRAQQQAYSAYLEAAVELDGPEIALVADACAEHGVWAFLGVCERGARAGRGTVYCTVAVISPHDGIVGSHRKLVPTHDERLVWGPGDGAGLQAYDVGGVRVGALLCWENWMPQARWALYADGADVHLGLWPGSVQLTRDITRFIAMEGRVWSVAAGGLLSLDDVPGDFPLSAELGALPIALPFDGGSAAAAPDGTWVAAPIAGDERLLLVDCDLDAVRQARLTFDPTGHYGRPDVFAVAIDRTRRTAARWSDAVS